MSRTRWLWRWDPSSRAEVAAGTTSLGADTEVRSCQGWGQRLVPWGPQHSWIAAPCTAADRHLGAGFLWIRARRRTCLSLISPQAHPRLGKPQRCGQGILRVLKPVRMENGAEQGQKASTGLGFPTVGCVTALIPLASMERGLMDPRSVVPAQQWLHACEQQEHQVLLFFATVTGNRRAVLSLNKLSSAN